MPNHPRLLAIILACLLPGTALAGAWTPDAGTAYHKFAVNYYQADQFFGTAEPGFEEFTDRNLSYYFEYGVDERRALFGSLAFKDITRRDNSTEADNQGLGDAELGLRLRLVREPVVLSTSLLVKLPYLYQEEDRLALGNGQEDFEWRWLLGRSLGSLAYFGLEAAYRLRLDEPSDEFRYLVEFGVSPTRWLYLRSKLDGIESARNGDAARGQPGNPLLNSEFDLGRLESTAGLRFGAASGWAVEFTWTEALYGNNTLDGNSAQLALIRSL